MDFETMGDLTYEELKVLNFETPSKELCDKAIVWFKNRVESYKLLYKESNNRVYLGKMGHYTKVVNSFEKQRKELYGRLL